MAAKKPAVRAAADTPGKRWMEDGDDARFVKPKSKAAPRKGGNYPRHWSQVKTGGRGKGKRSSSR